MQFNSKSKELFEKTPIRIAILKFAWPSILMMFVVGTYTFVDSILAIHLASKNYDYLATADYSSKDFVRLFMNASNPVVSFIIAVTMLFGMGASVRFSINLGAKRHEKALISMRSGFMSMLFVSIALIIILIFASKAWMSSLYEGAAANFKDPIINEGFSYLRILIFAIPLQMFNQIVSGFLRSEGHVKQVAIAMSAPLFVNLFFDWVFMGPMSLGIQGGSAATALSYGISSITLIYFMFRNKESYVKFKNLFGFTKFSPMALVGIVLVGSAPFLSNFAQSIAGTFETREVGDISARLGGDYLYLRNILAGVFPIFGFAFPMVLGFTQGGTPIASYNYGFGNYERVKQTYKWTVIYSFGFGLIVYALLAAPYMLGHSLLLLLGVEDKNIDASMRVLSILMLGLPLFGATVGGMVLFASTDRLSFSIIANSFRGFILFFPFLYLFKYLTINVVGEQEFFWWFYPMVGGTSSIITTLMALFVVKRLDRKHETLDSRLERWSTRFTYIPKPRSKR